MPKTQEPPVIHPAVGEANGAIVNGEKIVYEYDEAGEVVAWHKEEATLTDKVKVK